MSTNPPPGFPPKPGQPPPNQPTPAEETVVHIGVPKGTVNMLDPAVIEKEVEEGCEQEAEDKDDTLEPYRRNKQ